MSIFDRIRRIVKANMNLLLDKVEVAEQELDSRIKELEETIHEGRESAASYGATFKRLEHEAQQLGQKQQDLASEAEKALSAGDEAMARKVLSEKIKLSERIAQIVPGIEQGRRTFEMLRDNIIKLQEQLKAAKLKLQDLRSRKRVADAQQAFEEHLGKTMSVSGNGMAFDRLEDEVLQTEAEIEIRQEIRGDTLSDMELAENSRKLQVEAELEAMKDRLGKADQ